MKNNLFQLMVSGETGLTGLSVPRAVVEEQRPVRDSVTVQPRPTVVQTVLEMTLNRDSATLSPAMSMLKVISLIVTSGFLSLSRISDILIDSLFSLN